jgi:hypothetical protein
MNGRPVSKLLQTLGESPQVIEHVVALFSFSVEVSTYLPNACGFGSTGLRTVAILRPPVNGDFPVYVTVFATGHFAGVCFPESLRHPPLRRPVLGPTGTR